MVTNGMGCKNPSNSFVAATFERQKLTLLNAPKIRDREVGSSNPLALTNVFRVGTVWSIGLNPLVPS